MKIRMHRGGLAESMETAEELQSWSDFEYFCEKHEIDINSIRCEHYSGSDERIGWKDTWIIISRFKLTKFYNDPKEDTAPVAFSDGNVMELKEK